MHLQNAIVKRVDNALGLLLELPSPSSAPGDADAEAPDAAAAVPNRKQQGKGKKSKGGQGAGKPAAAAGSGQGSPSAAGYAHISAVSDTRVEKLDKVSMPVLKHIYPLRVHNLFLLYDRPSQGPSTNEGVRAWCQAPTFLMHAWRVLWASG